MSDFETFMERRSGCFDEPMPDCRFCGHLVDDHKGAWQFGRCCECQCVNYEPQEASDVREENADV